MLTPDLIDPVLAEHGHSAYRGKQVLDWIWKKRAASWEQMSNVPAALREQLEPLAPLRPLSHTLTKGSADTTRKFLFELHDRRYVETVLIPASPSDFGS